MNRAKSLKFSIVPSRKCTEREWISELQQCLQDVKLFEQLLYRLITLRFKLKMTVLKPEDQIVIEVSSGSFTRPYAKGRSGDQVVACLFLSYRELSSVYKPRTFPRIAEETRAEVEQWMENRDRRLRVRSDRWCNEQIIAPASLPAVILEYLSSPDMAIIELERELLEVQAGVTYHVRIKAGLLAQNSPLTFKETLWVNLERLGKLVAGRVGKSTTASSGSEENRGFVVQ